MENEKRRTIDVDRKTDVRSQSNTTNGTATVASDVTFVDGDNTTNIENGTAENPYDTIQEGVDNAVGHTVFVDDIDNSGSYNEEVVLRQGQTLTSEIQAFGGHSYRTDTPPIIDAGPARCNVIFPDCAFGVTLANNTTVNRLHIRRGDLSIYTQNIFDGGKHVITNNIIDSGLWILADQGTVGNYEAVIDGNVISGSDDGDFEFLVSLSANNSKINVHNNDIDGGATLQAIGDGNSLRISENYTKGIGARIIGANNQLDIIGNIVEFACPTCVAGGISANVFDVQGGSNDISIKNNRVKITGAEVIGISVLSSNADVEIAGNVVEVQSTDHSGDIPRGIWVINDTGTLIVDRNAIVTRTTSEPIGGFDNAGIHVSVDNTDVEITNNILISNEDIPTGISLSGNGCASVRGNALSNTISLRGLDGALQIAQASNKNDVSDVNSDADVVTDSVSYLGANGACQ